jgi:predicted flap endonuclease-1-like 5' DNA nuclease
MAGSLLENWIAVAVVVLLALALVAWLLVRSRRTRVELTRPGEDAPARRNQALIDAPSAASFPEIPPPTPEGMAGLGEAVQVAADLVPLMPRSSAGGDDLTRIKGLGPKIADQLATLGVTSFAQIAAWDEAEIDRIDAQLGRFQGRIRRDDWPSQAKLLAAGDTAGYEAKFGKL